MTAPHSSTTLNQGLPIHAVEQNVWAANIYRVIYAFAIETGGARNVHGLDHIIGQVQAVNRLREFANHFSQRGDVPDHILLVSAEGMGKKSIAHALADELGVPMTTGQSSQFEKKGDLTAVLTSLESGEVLFLENIHSLRQPLREILILALRDFRIDLVIGQGPGARVHRYQLQPFTCVASIPRERDLGRELRDAFPLVLRLQPYSSSELSQIAMQVAAGIRGSLTPSAAVLIANAANGSPHQVEVLVRRMAKGDNITDADVRKYFSILGIDSQPQASLGASALDGLSGIAFEKLVASLLARMGFHIEMTKVSGDGGVDIVATLDRPLVGGRYLIQCKRFAIGSPVGAPVVREFYGALRADNRAVKGIFVTTSNFTDQARNFARDLPIDLIDREHLHRLLSEHGLLGH